MATIKSLSYGILAGVLFTLLFSCGNSKNVYYFYEDGSGKMESVVDMGAILSRTKYIFTSKESDTSVKEKDGDEFDSNDLYEYDNSEEESIEEEIAISAKEGGDTNNISVFDLMFGEFTDKSKFDTTIIMRDMVPETILPQLDRPGLLNNVIVTAKVDEENEIFILEIVQKFADIPNIRDTQIQLDKASKLMGKDNAKSTQLANPNMTFDTKERFLYVPADSITNFDFLGTNLFGELITEEEIDEIIEATGVEKITTTYHLPSPIASVETESQYVLSEDKKSVEVSTELKALLKNGYVSSLRVRY